ncbi:hypothetical protein [Vallicoccus soli]|uniref:WD40 repeat domain-containing protein n=1 Tax=Vallicoccus soli TaxID=2339232 RepID=A0A3A3YWP9_9ACTN|nr:hypothetical protein [Vallicoccus soli]RJK95987.1 hypothetical protein D5H78_10430 [Vallicoccus soli]
MSPAGRPDAAARLERRYRLLLRLLPAPERAVRGEEMLGVLLACAAPGRARPSAAETADLLRAAVRSRARGLLVTDPVARLGALAAVALLLAATLLGAAVLERRGLLGGPSSADGRPALLTDLPGWEPRPAAVSASPAGPALVSYVDGDEDGEEFAVVLGADGTTARRVPLPGALRPEWPPLLSPDGASLALTADGGVRVHDLRDGSVGSLPGVRLPDDGGPRLLAWSTDSRALVVASPDATRVVDTATGAQTALAVGAGSAAVAADGRIAVSRAGRLAVHAPDGALLASARLPEGWRVAPAGWSRDGGTLAMTAAPASPYAQGEPGTPALLRDGGGAGVPSLLGPPDGTLPLAWQGRSLLVADGDALLRWQPGQARTVLSSTGDGSPAMHLRLATGLARDAVPVPARGWSAGRSSRRCSCWACSRRPWPCSRAGATGRRGGGRPAVPRATPCAGRPRTRASRPWWPCSCCPATGC